MRQTTSPNLSPLRFLRIVAAEYLAAYELAGKTPAASLNDLPEDWPEGLFEVADEDACAEAPAAIIDISEHPRFDASALTPTWSEPEPARQPLIGA